MNTKSKILLTTALLTTACGGLDVESTERGVAGGTRITPSGAWEAVGRIGGCTATLISEYAVLTAAHCIGTPGERRTFTLENGRGSADGTAIVHPRWCEDCSRGWFVYDYAIIKLDQSIYENPNVDSVGLTPMPVYRETLSPGDSAFFYGFGNYGLDANGTPDCDDWDGEGQYAPATLTTFDEDWNYVFESDSVSICSGDSGGPLIVYDDGYRVAGVTSWNDLANDLSVYKPTYMVADWIAENAGAPDNPGNTWGYCVYYQDGADGAYLSTQHGGYSTMPSGWSNSISSVRVKKGNKVSLYDGTAYQTHLATFDGFNGSNCNEHGCLHELAGTTLDNRVSSVNCQSQLPASTWGHCVYYDRFGGSYVSTQGDLPSFTGNNAQLDNRISQIWVKSGYLARVYPRANYQPNGTHWTSASFSGNSSTARCNAYGCLHDLTGGFAENTISSVTCAPR